MKKPQLRMEDERKVAKYESIMSELDEISEEYGDEDVFVSAMICKLLEIYTDNAISRGGAQEGIHNLMIKVGLGCALYMKSITFNGEENNQ